MKLGQQKITMPSRSGEGIMEEHTWEFAFFWRNWKVRKKGLSKFSCITYRKMPVRTLHIVSHIVKFMCMYFACYC